VHRQMSAPGLQFKGSGWYITDYAQKGKSGGDSSTAKSESGEKSDGAKTDTASGGSSTKAESAPSTATTTTKG